MNFELLVFALCCLAAIVFALVEPSPRNAERGELMFPDEN